MFVTCKASKVCCKWRHGRATCAAQRPLMPQPMAEPMPSCTASFVHRCTRTCVALKYATAPLLALGKAISRRTPSPSGRRVPGSVSSTTPVHLEGKRWVVVGEHGVDIVTLFQTG